MVLLNLIVTSSYLRMADVERLFKWLCIGHAVVLIWFMIQKARCIRRQRDLTAATVAYHPALQLRITNRRLIMKEYIKPELITKSISFEDVISVDYTVDGEGEEITWSDLWTSAMNKQ